MPTRVSLEEIQAWLDADKLEISPNDPLPEEVHATNIAFAKLGQIFDTSVWTNQATTPALIRTIISGLTAARRYNKIYSESDDAGNRYAGKLEAILTDMLNQIVHGELTLVDVEGGGSGSQGSANDPRYFPDDTTGALAVFNASGLLVSREGSEDIKFRMGQSF